MTTLAWPMRRAAVSTSTPGWAVSERRFGNRRSMCPYKRPYNSGTTRIRLLPSPSVMAALTCGKRPVGHRPAPSFPASFRFPNALVLT